MGFEGVVGFHMSGLIDDESPKLNRSISCPDSKRFQEDKFEGLVQKFSIRRKLDMGQMEEPVHSVTLESPTSNIHESMTREISLLEKRLQSQFELRRVLESALGYGLSSADDAKDTTATELIREIAVLEFEVTRLEQYLLSLYRKAFDQKVPSVSPSAGTKPSDVKRQKDSADVKSRGHFSSTRDKDPRSFDETSSFMESKARCQSSISQHSAFISRADHDDSAADEIAAKAVRACHSQPLSMTEFAQNTSSNLVSLAEHLGTRISDHLPETPNRLSEDMIKCMSAIYCKLSYQPVSHQDVSSSSPNSTSSSMSQFSPQEHGNSWSPGLRKDSSFDVKLDNPFHINGLQEYSGPYSTMIEVPWIYRDRTKVGDVDYLLEKFRSIISRLQEIDPRKLTHPEKIAFWINIHNSLVMHAFLAFGIPRNNVKRVLLLLKAAYNIGGYTINADMIQSSILGCRMSRPGQWIRKLVPLVPSRPKVKTGHDCRAYALDKPEPLLYFALSSGSHSDPAVRVYTPKKIFQELETAKDEYIRATFGVQKNRKITLPKLVESFSKDSNFSHDDMLKTIRRSLPESLSESIGKCCAAAEEDKQKKGIVEWVHHNFSFRYLISKEVVKC